MSELRLSGGEDHISNTEIMHRIGVLADYYSERYAYEEEVVILDILQGANSFAVHLAQQIDHPKINFAITQLGRREGTEAHKPMFKLEDIPTDVAGKALLVVEGIDRTRATLTEAMPRFRRRQPSRLDLAVLINNADSKKIFDDIDADTVEYGFETTDRYVVGFGLGWKGLYRDFKHVTAAENIGGETPETKYYIPVVDKREAARLAKFGGATIELNRILIAGI